jgi:DNA mismatch repair protein MutS
MAFYSILFPSPEASSPLTDQEPSSLRDLNIDQVIASIVGPKDERQLKSFFCTPLRDPETVRYRQAVARDLMEHPDLFETVARFSDKMRSIRAYQSQIARMSENYDRYERRLWLVDAVEDYVEAVSAFAESLGGVDLRAQGLKELSQHLHDYTSSAAFAGLKNDQKQLRERLAAVHYCMDINGLHVTVTAYEDERDYSSVVEETFAKFREGEAKDYRVKFREEIVEPRVLNALARIFRETFEQLDQFWERHRDFLDEKTARFAWEVQFYVTYLAYIERVRAGTLPACLPEVSADPDDIYAADAYDIALAEALSSETGAVVPNDFSLSKPERIIVVTGPNQGGKTTFARTFGQLHYLASLGLPVPASAAKLMVPDGLFTHFERQEAVESLTGKLEDELIRVRSVLEAATHSSVVVMNESFSSTTLKDALFLGTKVLTALAEVGAVCVYVTFVDELASLDDRVVSMVAEVDPEDPDVRTFRVLRRPADGLAHAAALARKYGLTYEALRKRVSP